MNTLGILLLAWGAFLAGWFGRSCFTCPNCVQYIDLARKLVRQMKALGIDPENIIEEGKCHLSK